MKTPNIAALIQLASTVMARDYLSEARRTMETLGLAGYSVEALCELLGPGAED